MVPTDSLARFRLRSPGEPPPFRAQHRFLFRWPTRGKGKGKGKRKGTGHVPVRRTLEAREGALHPREKIWKPV